MSLPKVCEQAVPHPKDAPPIRSPQAVHSFITSRIKGKQIVEIGTRNGDGMNCFTHYAKKATAIEYAKEYCISLEANSARIRSAHPTKGFTVTCSDYRTGGVLDGDVITWWEQAPLLNVEALKHLHAEQQAGRVRESAEAILLFDPQWGEDVKSWHNLCPLAGWSVKVPFDETARCIANNGGKSGKGSETCRRASGHFVVAGIPVKRMAGWAALTEEQRAACGTRHAQSWETVVDPSKWQLYETPEYLKSKSLGHKAAHKPGPGGHAGLAIGAPAADVAEALSASEYNPYPMGVALGIAAMAALVVLVLRTTIAATRAPAFHKVSTTPRAAAAEEEEEEAMTK